MLIFWSFSMGSAVLVLAALPLFRHRSATALGLPGAVAMAGMWISGALMVAGSVIASALQ
jgi:hypothetical protein